MGSRSIALIIIRPETEVRGSLELRWLLQTASGGYSRALRSSFTHTHNPQWHRSASLSASRCLQVPSLDSAHFPALTTTQTIICIPLKWATSQRLQKKKTYTTSSYIYYSIFYCANIRPETDLSPRAVY